jgi:DNA-binding XRE family transcriptional regulator
MASIPSEGIAVPTPIPRLASWPHQARRADRAAAIPAGHLLRHWRRARRLSQLALAVEAATTSRHLSFIASGRSQPSREMVLRLARVLDVPIVDAGMQIIWF